MPITITAAEAPADRLLFDYIITYINKPDHASKIVALRALKLLVGTPFEADVRNRTAEIVEALCMDLEYDREIDAPDANTHAMEVINAFGLLSDAAAVEEHACMRVLPDVWRKVLSYACPLIESSPRNSGPMLGYPPGLKLKIRLRLDSYFELYGHVDHA